MDSKRKSLLNSSKPGTPVGNKRASMAKTPKQGTPKPLMTPKAATPALNGNQRRKSGAADLGNISAKKRKSMAEETPSKKKTAVKVEEPEEDSDESDEELGSDGNMSDEMHSDEGGSDIEDEEDAEAESDEEEEGEEEEEEEDDSEEEKEEEKPKQKKAKRDTKPTKPKQGVEAQPGVAAPSKPSKKNVDKELSNPEQTIFVGNLPKDITQDKIKKMFNKYGKITSIRLRSAPIEDPRVSKKVAVIKKQFHSERKNINAYVVFENKESARKALQENFTEVEGHRIRVDMAKQQKPENKLAIFVGNLPFDATEDELYNLFTSCGGISSIRVIRDTSKGIGKGFAYVNFETTDAVELALLKDGAKLHDRPLRVNRSQENAKKRRVKGFKGEKKSDKGKGAMQNRKPKPRSMGKAGDKTESPKNSSPAASFQGQKANQGKVAKKRNRGKKDAKKQAAIETLVKSLPGSAKKAKA